MHTAADQVLLAETDAHRRARAHPEKTYIRAAAYPSQYFDAGLASARAKSWRVYEVPCGHDVMLDMPERLTEILQEAA
jgi:hypothetical protein